MYKTWTAMLAACAVAGTAIAADQADTGRPRWDPAAMQQRQAQREARRADEMALLIGLRPDQRPAFDNFLKSLRPPHGGPDAAMPKPPAEGSTLPARLDAMQAAIDRHDAEAKQRIAAARTFYAGLTTDQQRRFDALEDLRKDHMHGRPDDHGGFGPRGGFGGDHPPAPPPAGD